MILELDTVHPDELISLHLEYKDAASDALAIEHTTSNSSGLVVTGHHRGGWGMEERNYS